MLFNAIIRRACGAWVEFVPFTSPRTLIEVKTFDENDTSAAILGPVLFSGAPSREE